MLVSKALLEPIYLIKAIFQRAAEMEILQPPAAYTHPKGLLVLRRRKGAERSCGKVSRFRSETFPTRIWLSHLVARSGTPSYDEGALAFLPHAGRGETGEQLIGHDLFHRRSSPTHADPSLLPGTDRHRTSECGECGECCLLAIPRCH